MRAANDVFGGGDEEWDNPWHETSGDQASQVLRRHDKDNYNLFLSRLTAHIVPCLLHQIPREKRAIFQNMLYLSANRIWHK